MSLRRGALLAVCALVGAWAPLAALAQATPAERSVARRDAVHTDTFWSQSLGIRKALTVYLPPSYASSPSRRFPVLVYLHGMWGSERDWVDSGHLDRSLDSLAGAGKGEAIVVMPDGDDGWYTTWNLLAASPPCASDTTRKEPAATYCVPWTHYDDYIARDVVAHVDARYRTIRNRDHRGIAGLSMGGYGAVSLALAYPDVFGAAASHSGVVSLRYLGPQPYAAPARYANDSSELKLAVGSLWSYLSVSFGRDTIGWAARDPARMAVRTQQRASTGSAPVPALFLDCGTEDGYVEQNRDFHASLVRLGVSHVYTEWPGKHDWTYWRQHVAESLVFLLQRTAP